MKFLFCKKILSKIQSCRNMLQKQSSRGVLEKRCSENLQQTYWRTLMPKCDLNKVAFQITLRHGCSPANLLHIFGTPFLQNTSGRLLLMFVNIFNKYVLKGSFVDLYMPAQGIFDILSLKQTNHENSSFFINLNEY